MSLTNPPAFRTIRVLCAAITMQEQLLRLAYAGAGDPDRALAALADLWRQLDEAEALWALHNGREPAKLPERGA
jgi:hypothetical protein